MELSTNVLAAQNVYCHISLSMHGPSKQTLYISFKLSKLPETCFHITWRQIGLYFNVSDDRIVVCYRIKCSLH